MAMALAWAGNKVHAKVVAVSGYPSAGAYRQTPQHALLAGDVERADLDAGDVDLGHQLFRLGGAGSRREGPQRPAPPAPSAPAPRTGRLQGTPG